ncbi:MAG: hypothetical protein ACYSUI_08040 [Planctomycetota bacterium]|jgi:hypothetical protein
MTDVQDVLSRPVRNALERLRTSNDHIVELRAPEVPMRYGRPGTVAGYFDDLGKAAEAAVQLDGRKARAVYVTLNPVNPALLARSYNRLQEHPKATTADHDIIRRAWFPVDVDPVRPAGVSANDEEIERAKAVALKVAEWLSRELDDRPALWGFSGNGWHLLWRVDFPNDETRTALCKKWLQIAGDKFTYSQVSIDQTVYNAARIWKLYGTTARKGDNVPKIGRIHRQARLVSEGFTDG